MKTARKLSTVFACAAATMAAAQVPDLLNAFDAGGRAMGAGGALNSTSADSLSTHHNPAGLGYVSAKTVGVAGRNYPTSATRVTGPLTQLRQSSTPESGKVGLSHVGWTFPLNGGKGTIGVSFTVGGFMHDDQFGTNLSGGISRYLDAVRAKTDFFDIGWGKAVGDQSFSYGVGLVIANQQIYNRQQIVFADPGIPTINTRSDDSSVGIGVQAGAMFIPKNRPNMTFSIVGRTPIKLDENQGAISLYPEIPGRIGLGVALRQDGYRGGKDYAVYGAELNAFFGGKDSDRIKRDDNLAANVGVEYNYSWNRATIPLRVGYAFIPSGGTDFDSRDTFTYGFGYRPIDKPWSIDINFGRAPGGAKDTSIYFNYRF